MFGILRLGLLGMGDENLIPKVEDLGLIYMGTK